MEQPFGLGELPADCRNYVGDEDTATELIKPVGKTGRYFAGGMYFPVEILNTRHYYGNTQYLITPIGGRGQKWAAAGVIVDDAPAS